jgi:hypothetical protein
MDVVETLKAGIVGGVGLSLVSWWTGTGTGLVVLDFGFCFLLNIVVGDSDGTMATPLDDLDLDDEDLPSPTAVSVDRLDLETLLPLTPNRSMRHLFTQLSKRRSELTPGAVCSWSG